MTTFIDSSHAYRPTAILHVPWISQRNWFVRLSHFRRIDPNVTQKLLHKAAYLFSPLWTIRRTRSNIYLPFAFVIWFYLFDEMQHASIVFIGLITHHVARAIKCSLKQLLQRTRTFYHYWIIPTVWDHRTKCYVIEIENEHIFPFFRFCFVNACVGASRWLL